MGSHPGGALLRTLALSETQGEREGRYPPLRAGQFLPKASHLRSCSWDEDVKNCNKEKFRLDCLACTCLLFGRIINKGGVPIPFFFKVASAYMNNGDCSECSSPRHRKRVQAFLFKQENRRQTRLMSNSRSRAMHCGATLRVSRIDVPCALFAKQTRAL